ncbi:BadF/BadG/BcrA/BcrD ATPase family protein [Asaia prunellae]|uniref:BadF/BadG/BcrA/BcrD ATPase family protein n=1 Tax=Asaia prunellae TaxID=610245 RepID=UPI000685DB49|nr:BadF/BadG/BcrA/BcrD ATPase family protein [Asaia prunellae]
MISGLMVGQQERLASAAFGLAGFGESARISMELSETVSVLCPAPHSIHNDVDMACRGAFLNGPGILLLSGTGSMGWGLGTNGQTVRVGGWGSLFGDEGSAYWIGRMALIRLAHCLDGRETAGNDYVSRIAFLQGWPDDKALCTAALQDWYASLDDVRPKVAALAVGIGRLAEQGCVVAREIFEQAAALLAAHVHALRRSLGEPHLRWSYAGGTMQSVVLREASFGNAAYRNRLACPLLEAPYLLRQSGRAGLSMQPLSHVLQNHSKLPGLYEWR